ncbi:hypothetical protein AHAS_Ahas11G0267100 [Arachis hypogaea]
MHLISWKTLCQPKHEGGMGFRKLSSMNDAFLAKVLWQLYEDSNQLWAKVLLHKYCDGSREDMEVQVRNTDSTLWREIMKLRPLIQLNSFKSIRNGLSNRFWNDHWLIEKVL